MLLQKYCSRISVVHAAAAANTANQAAATVNTANQAAATVNSAKQAAAAVIPQLLLATANYLLLSIL